MPKNNKPKHKKQNNTIHNQQLNIYDTIFNKLTTDQSVFPQIKNLHDNLCPYLQLTTNKNITHKQILSQIYQHTLKSINKIRSEIKQQDMEQQQVEMENNVEDDIQNGDENENGIDQEQQQQEQISYGNEQQQQQYIQHEGNDQYKYKRQQKQQQLENIQQQQQQSQGDVGLYGQQLDQQDMQSYQNQSMDDPQFKQMLNRNQQKYKEKQYPDEQQYGQYPQGQQQQENKQDNAIEDHFDYFRDLERQTNNNKDKDNKNKDRNKDMNKDGKEKTALQSQIQRLQQKVTAKKQWAFTGQIKARQRPTNSLLQQDLTFKSGLKYTHQTINQQYNKTLDDIIKQRILDQLFDDRVRYTVNSNLRQNFAKDPISTQKSNKGLAQLYQLQFKNYLGIGDNKNDRVKKQIMQGFKQVNYYLDQLSNFNFVPKSTINSNRNINSNSKQVTVVVQEKIPMTMLSLDASIVNNNEIHNSKKQDFESANQIDKKGKRTKNKRISRIRKKQQDKKKMHKKIQYGGMTKFQVNAQKKLAANKSKYPKNKDHKNKDDKTKGYDPKDNNNIDITGKFNKSNQFFKKINSSQHNMNSKGNPNLSKMKI